MQHAKFAGKLHPSPERALTQAFDRVKRSLFDSNIVPDKFHARGKHFEPGIADRSISVTEVSIEIRASLTADSAKEEVRDEAYELDIDARGTTNIRCTTYNGAIHALGAFCQLFYAHLQGSSFVYTPCAPVSIRDRPSFQHRGLSLDIARNRLPPKTMTRVIDAMSLSRLNKLHLHAWDSQSWPIEIPSLPELATQGAYHPSQIWNVQDLARVQRYGLERGVEVYFEADLPGHTASVHHAYPELITGYNMQPWPRWCVEPPSGQLKLD